MTKETETACTLVTGGSSGIGLAIVNALAAKNRKVVCVDKNPIGRDSISQFGDLIRFRQFDLENTQGIPGLIDGLVQDYGPITRLVNNAGIHIGSLLEDTSEEVWNKVIRINLSVPFLLIRHLIPVMKKAGRGAIVNMSSRNAFRSTTGNNAYDASKAALLALTRTAAGELAKYNIRVNALCPGIISTPMKDESSDAGKLIKSIHRKLVPLDRYGTADEVAAIVLFLLSDQASYITGSSLIADGGQLACMDNSRLMEIPGLGFSS